VRFGRDDFEELTDVRVMETTMVVDLACEGGGEGFRDLFDGATGGGETMGAEVNEAVGSCYESG
jgi:hypothetical protein